MPTNAQIVPCPEKQAIKKCIRDVPCPRAKPKKRQDVSCPGMERKKACKRYEEVSCPAIERRKALKCVSQITCPGKVRETSPKCVKRIACPGEIEHRASSGKCPKCEENRIQNLECEVFQLRKEIECMKYERKEAEKAIQRAILRSARALGGRLKPVIPCSVEKLLDSCDSDVSASTSYSVTFCGTKATPLEIQPCRSKAAKRKEELACCESCCAD